VTQLEWEGCVNVRDLGGLPGIEPGRLVRSDTLQRLSDAGWQALVDHGVTRVVDLRFPHERALDPPRELPVEVVHVSVLGEWSREGEEEFGRRMDETDDAFPYLVWSYLEFLERHRAEFGRAVRAVADAPPGAVLVHCHGGKDRTGLVVALLLRVAGLDLETIGADYAATEENLRARQEAFIAAAPDEREAHRRRIMLPAPAQAMVDVLQELERRYGSTEEYLRVAGVPDEAIERIRRRLARGRAAAA